jgi:hypothetical protein
MRDVVNYIMTLYPTPKKYFPEGYKYTRHEAILIPEKIRKIKEYTHNKFSSDFYKVVFFKVYDVKNEKVVEYCYFPVTKLKDTYFTFVLAIDSSKSIIMFDTYQGLFVKNIKTLKEINLSPLLVKAAGKDEKSMPSFTNDDLISADNDSESVSLVREFVNLSKMAYFSLLFGIVQDEEDLQSLQKIKPPSSEGERVYRRLKCFECHGHKGNAKGPESKVVDPHPGNLTDGRYMLQQEITDEYLRELIMNGGRYLNISDTKPSYKGQITPEELEELIKFTRSLVIPLP